MSGAHWSAKVKSKTYTQRPAIDDQLDAVTAGVSGVFVSTLDREKQALLKADRQRRANMGRPPRPIAINPATGAPLIDISAAPSSMETMMNAANRGEH